LIPERASDEVVAVAPLRRPGVCSRAPSPFAGPQERRLWFPLDGDMCW
jgi:hypothetical protein